MFSTDYWPEKIDTTGTNLFGLPWQIFSAEEIHRFVERAKRHGLFPVRDPHEAVRRVRQRPIRFENREYTFLYGAFIRGQEEGEIARP